VAPQLRQTAETCATLAKDGTVVLGVEGQVQALEVLVPL
jgi:hypothetical protein